MPTDGTLYRYWTHTSKYKNKNFKGSYERDKDNERVFVLKNMGGKRKITFESWSLAKKAGWVYHA